MIALNHIAQPSINTTLDALVETLGSGSVESVDVAAAYVTTTGAHALLSRVGNELGSTWDRVPKRWVTSFDYCRTDPLALSKLLAMPNSSVRIHDARFCVANNGSPRKPFHPKAFLIRTNLSDFVLAGSGNISRSGLERGVEAGLVAGVDRSSQSEAAGASTISAMRAWFDTEWRKASTLDDQLLNAYGQIFESVANLKSPSPTEDDVADAHAGKGALTLRDLQKLRACKHFWIEAGNITRNRGPTLPGNQLMLKRLSRVFFGFGPEVLPENSPIGEVLIGFGGAAGVACSLTYSDNKMDKLVLPVPVSAPVLGPSPIPGASARAAYDNQLLLFRRVGATSFDLTIGVPGDKRRWAKRSADIGAHFKMTSGREWGVF